MKKKMFYLSSIIFVGCFVLIGCTQEDSKIEESQKTEANDKEKIFENVSFLPKTNTKYYLELEEQRTGEIHDNVDGYRPYSNTYKKEGKYIVEYDHDDYSSYKYFETEEGLFAIATGDDGANLILPYPIKLGQKWSEDGEIYENEVVSIDEKLEINGKIYENLVKVKGTFKNPQYGHFYIIYGEGMGILQNKTAGDELITVVKIEEN